jgi:hypothetical protein
LSKGGFHGILVLTFHSFGHYPELLGIGNQERPMKSRRAVRHLDALYLRLAWIDAAIQALERLRQLQAVRLREACISRNEDHDRHLSSSGYPLDSADHYL